MLALVSALLCAAVLMAGCATPSKPGTMNGSEAWPWRGRLSVRIESQPVQSFTAGFELSGNADAGALTLYTPLGTTAAAMAWSPQLSLLRVNSQTQQFSSLGALMQQTLGTALPVEALFAWLAGEPMAAVPPASDMQEKV
ncbi:MAG: outer membrane lipoprotein LolB [Betaproteobacteria bacterium]|nr:outer membrane lipoprotein LolB [Betaproteobacteria bacterium]